MSFALQMMLTPAMTYSSSARSQPKSEIEFWTGLANPKGSGCLSDLPLNALASHKAVTGEGPYLRVLCMRFGGSGTRESLRHNIELVV